MKRDRPQSGAIDQGEQRLSDGEARKRHTTGQVIGGLVGGAVLGAAGGAVLGAGLDWLGAATGAVIGGAVFGLGEAITTMTTTPGKLKPLPYRILTSALAASILGWLLGLLLGTGEPLLIGIAIGAFFGLLGMRPSKLALGALVGGAVGLIFQLLEPEIALAVMAALIALVYRAISAFLYRGRPLVRMIGERVPAAEVRYVVPFESRTKYVGADYVEQLARVKGGTFRRNPPDVGILESLDSLAGPTFEPERVHPLIREFYEHTSRFQLSILPRWKPWIRPGYALFKGLVARPLGQAAIPSNIEEAQRGMVSTIDTVELEGEEGIGIRGWVRSFADSGEPIYVGIYTSFRHEGRGYVSVGFPLPDANFTATLLPMNRDDGLLLTSRTALPFPGHYLSAVDRDSAELTVLKLLYFQEKIEVYVADDQLKTDHRFYLAGQNFLLLDYSIDRIGASGLHRADDQGEQAAPHDGHPSATSTTTR